MLAVGDAIDFRVVRGEFSVWMHSAFPAARSTAVSPFFEKHGVFGESILFSQARDLESVANECRFCLFVTPMVHSRRIPLQASVPFQASSRQEREVESSAHIAAQGKRQRGRGIEPQRETETCM